MQCYKGYCIKVRFLLRWVSSFPLHLFFFAVAVTKISKMQRFHARVNPTSLQHVVDAVMIMVIREPQDRLSWKRRNCERFDRLYPSPVVPWSVFVEFTNQICSARLKPTSSLNAFDAVMTMVVRKSPRYIWYGGCGVVNDLVVVREPQDRVSWKRRNFDRFE